jgi:predicted PurR-regulated permease PerM
MSHMETASSPRLTDSQITGVQRPPTRNWSQLIIAAGVVLFFCYTAELVLAVLLLSVLLAFILSPVVAFLQTLRLPRSLASATAVVLLLTLVCVATYVSYSQATSFLQDLPKYSGKIREELARLRQKAEKFESNANVLPQPTEAESKNVLTVRTASTWTDVLTHGFGSFSQLLFAASFVPFLVYFMLSWQQHVRSATVMLFRMENRHTAYVTLGLIAKMMRSFMVGNFLVGVFMALVSTALFAGFRLPFFYFVGPISGFFSLVPYLGVLLALIPPLIVGIGQLDSGDIAFLIIAILALHLFSLNVLYPKILGNRLQLNPLAVTISLLFWGWFWGAIGLLLAIPITGAMKIIFDHVGPLKPYAAWLGE